MSTCGLGCELEAGHDGRHDDLLGNRWDDQPDAAVLKANNARLADEKAALIRLLAAVQAAADLPLPQSDQEGVYNVTVQHRADTIAVYTEIRDDIKDSRLFARMIDDKADAISAIIARPLRYTPRSQVTE